jgi:hypothetical protein
MPNYLIDSLAILGQSAALDMFPYGIQIVIKNGAYCPKGRIHDDRRSLIDQILTQCRQFSSACG